MELSFILFPLFKFLVFLLFIYLVYKAYKKRSKGLGFLALGFAIFLIYSPVKLDLNTAKQQQQANLLIQKSKSLPSKVTDDSFESNAASFKGITKEDLK